MARFEDEQFGEYYVQIPDAEAREELGHILWGTGAEVDELAMGMFERAMFDDDNQAYQDLVDYLWDEYGIDFEDAFDWEDFRSWYDAA